MEGLGKQMEHQLETWFAYGAVLWPNPEPEAEASYQIGTRSDRPRFGSLATTPSHVERFPSGLWVEQYTVGGCQF